MAFRYDAEPVLDDISFDLSPGRILALTGPNGAGKSTLLKCVNGLLRPQKGSVRLNGRAIGEMRGKEIARTMAYVPQTVGNTFPFKVIDMVLQGRYPHRKGRARGDDQDLEKAFRALWLMGAEDLAMKDFGAISGGQRQKATIARAIAQEAKILLLDEPTSNLDIRCRLETMDLLRELVKTKDLSAIVSLHDLNLAARYADKLVMLEKGRIFAAGDPATVLTPETIAAAYQVDVEVGVVQGRPHIVPLRPLSDRATLRR